jgi:hypothetical protein
LRTLNFAIGKLKAEEVGVECLIEDFVVRVSFL